jgi:phospholipid N-methyltransferase
MKVVVELGPGPAVATKPILASLDKRARYLVVESNPIFVSHLRKIGDTRLEVVEGDARKLKQLLTERGIRAADAIIASIPFTYLTPADRTALVSAAYDSLRPGGDFIVFHQYSPLMAKYLKKKFGKVHTEFELFNVLPCFLMHAKK